jgi:hypothetical protein
MKMFNGDMINEIYGESKKSYSIIERKFILIAEINLTEKEQEIILNHIKQNDVKNLNEYIKKLLLKGG